MYMFYMQGPYVAGSHTLHGSNNYFGLDLQACFIWLIYSIHALVSSELIST